MTPPPDEHSVRIEPHGRTLRLMPGQPILEAALSAGLNLPHSCKSGHCGSCRARLLAGAFHYPNGPPLGITAEEAQRGQILLCQARADSDLTVQARLIASVADVEIKTLPCRIARLRPLAPDVMQLWLRLPAVERLRFHPGQYLDVLLENGRRRSFSIASPPHDSELIELHVRRVNGGGFSERLFGAAAGVGGGAPLEAGSLLRIEGPIGQFSYRQGSDPVLMHPARPPFLLGRAPHAGPVRGSAGARVGAPPSAAQVYRRVVGSVRGRSRASSRRLGA